ncbi:B3 domain-containing protein [Hordeum vulgare]|nr:B3 domain-containing protein [Hordeum vulgare]
MKLWQADSGLRRLWDVEVVFDTKDHMYLDRGWKQFVRADDLRHEYFLVFRYDDNTMFTMIVFNMTMCRRRYQDNDDAGNGSSNNDSGYSKSSSDSGYSKSSIKDEEEQSGEEEEQSGDDEVVADDDLAMVVADDGLAMVVADDDLAMVVPEDGHAMVVPDNDPTMVVVPGDGLAMVIPQLGNMTMPIVVEEYIPQSGPRPILGLRHSKRIRIMKEKEKKEHHLKIIHGKDDKVKCEANRCKEEPPLIEYEKVRVRNMMRTNRMFQSLGISAIASMIRKTNDVQEGRTNEVQEGSGVIDDDPEYNPKEYEVIDGEEMDDVVVHKTVKALKESRTKRPGVKKTTNNKKTSSETSVAMPPGRVMAPPTVQTKRILELDEPTPDRVTRQKAKMAVAMDHQESPLCMDFESSAQMGDEFPPMDEETTLCMDERGTVCLRLTTVAPSIDRNAVISEEEQQLVLQSGKFTFAMLSFTSAFSKWK